MFTAGEQVPPPFCVGQDELPFAYTSIRVLKASRTDAVIPVLVVTPSVDWQTPDGVFHPRLPPSAGAPLPSPASSQPKLPGTVASPVTSRSPVPRAGSYPSSSSVLVAGSVGLQIMTGGVLQIALSMPATAIACALPPSEPTTGVSAKLARRVAVRTHTKLASASSMVVLAVGQSVPLCASAAACVA